MNYLTEALSSHHDKKAFKSNNLMLDDYFHKQAKQDIDRKLSACFVLSEENGLVKGYYTLSGYSIRKEIVPEKISNKLPPAYSNLPVTLLGRLAIDINWQKKGLGELLLLDALKRSLDASLTVGSMAVIVDPVNKSAYEFYLRYGFISLPGSGKMFLPMKTISTLFSKK